MVFILVLVNYNNPDVEFMFWIIVQNMTGKKKIMSLLNSLKALLTFLSFGQTVKQTNKQTN